METNCSCDITLGQGLGEFLLGSIEIVDVGCVMFAVMELHNFGTDDWLKSIVGIRKLWQSVFDCSAEKISFYIFE